MSPLVGTAVHNSRAIVGRHGAAGAAQGLNLLDNIVAAGHLAKDDVLAIQPAGLVDGDEKLGAVPATMHVSDKTKGIVSDYSRVGTSVSHGQQARLGMAVDEVLVGELLAVDGAATGTLDRVSHQFDDERIAQKRHAA